MEPSSFVGAETAFSPCLPYSGALGNAHGYTVFSREEELKRQQESWAVIAQALSGQ